MEIGTLPISISISTKGVHMIINFNYWTKVLIKFSIVFITALLVYLGFRLAIFYLPFFIAFLSIRRESHSKGVPSG